MRLLDVGAVFLVEVLDRLVKDAQERLGIVELIIIGAESFNSTLVLLPYRLAALVGELDVNLAPVLAISGTRYITARLERADDLGDARPG